MNSCGLLYWLNKYYTIEKEQKFIDKFFNMFGKIFNFTNKNVNEKIEEIIFSANILHEQMIIVKKQKKKIKEKKRKRVK